MPSRMPTPSSTPSSSPSSFLGTLLVLFVVLLGVGPLLFDRTRPSVSFEPRSAGLKGEADPAAAASLCADAAPQQQGHLTPSLASAEPIAAWRHLIPPTIDVPGHDAFAEARRNAIIARAKRGNMGPPVRNDGGRYPGVLHVTSTQPPNRYALGGEGLLRAEPHVAGGVSLFVINWYQPKFTSDSFYARLVGPSVFAVHFSKISHPSRMDTATQQLPHEQCPDAEACDVQGEYGEAKYLGNYHIFEPGIYTLSVYLEYRHLPDNLTEVPNPLGNDPDPLKANQNTFAKADILLYTGLVDARYPDDTAMGRRVRAEGDAAYSAADLKLARPTFKGDGLEPRACASAGALPGRWVLPASRHASVCDDDAWRPLLRDGWEWRPYGCRIPELCAAEAAACVKEVGSITVAGDSVAREVFDDIGSSLLGRDATWREIFEHKHASGTRFHDGAAIRMLWLPDPLKSIPEQLEGGVQNAEQYTKSRALVVSAGYWYVYRTSLEDYMSGVDRLIAAADKHLKPNGTELVWLTIPSGWMNFGYRVRPRIRVWNDMASERLIKAGWRVVDLFEMSHARPEKTDGTHIGDDTDRGQIQGMPVLSRHGTNALLVSLCGAEERIVRDTRPVPAQVEWPNWPHSHRRASSSSALFAAGAATGARLNLTAAALHPASKPASASAAPPRVTARQRRMEERRYHIGRLGAHAKGT